MEDYELRLIYDPTEFRIDEKGRVTELGKMGPSTLWELEYPHIYGEHNVKIEPVEEKRD